MTELTNEQLVERAEGVLNPRAVKKRLFGDVGSTLVTRGGNVFSGVCIDTGSGTGFCAEHAAIAAMVTAGEYEIARIVAVSKDEAGILFVIPPGWRCRQFISQIDPSNLDTEVLLAGGEVLLLRELLPHNEWPDRPERPKEVVGSGE